jgi:hypothetical protein
LAVGYSLKERSYSDHADEWRVFTPDTLGYNGSNAYRKITLRCHNDFWNSLKSKGIQTTHFIGKSFFHTHMPYYILKQEKNRHRSKVFTCLVPRFINSTTYLSAYAEDDGLWPWMNAKRITSADSAEEHGANTGFARGAPMHGTKCSLSNCDIMAAKMRYGSCESKH